MKCLYVLLTGMRYLHYGAHKAIVHGDLKSLNGMLYTRTYSNSEIVNLKLFISVLVYPGNVLKVSGRVHSYYGLIPSFSDYRFWMCQI